VAAAKPEVVMSWVVNGIAMKLRAVDGIRTRTTDEFILGWDIWYELDCSALQS
jgi:hypothetical protein